MSDDTYNGWTNRETWAVALHINNDQGWQESVLAELREYVSREAVVTPASWEAGDIIRENVEETLMNIEPRRGAHGVWYAVAEGQWLALNDIGSLWRVNWTELGASFLSDLDEE